MKAMCSSETSANFQRTTRRYISDDRTLHVYYISEITINFFSCFLFLFDFSISSLLIILYFSFFTFSSSCFASSVDSRHPSPSFFPVSSLSSSLISLLFLFTSPYCFHLTLLQPRLLFLFLFLPFHFLSVPFHFLLLRAAMRFLVHLITKQRWKRSDFGAVRVTH
jgi:hypothetical protein